MAGREKRSRGYGKPAHFETPCSCPVSCLRLLREGRLVAQPVRGAGLEALQSSTSLLRAGRWHPSARHSRQGASISSGGSVCEARAGRRPKRRLVSGISTRCSSRPGRYGDLEASEVVVRGSLHPLETHEPQCVELRCRSEVGSETHLHATASWRHLPQPTGSLVSS